MKQDNIEFSGEVTEELGNSMFRVSLDNSDHEIICTISGRIRKNFIKIMAGDKVKVDVSPYDLTRGRIKQRVTNNINISENNKSSINNKKKK